ncbi:aldo/keto reductase [Aureobasidium pullulans]|uniref:Aldo/keto reductase n=1 Tax=Aureobasidium pullulans TaxID=5580 RepID=A0A4S9V297_AURPU|nr:aldo/keto reductase [Aureobasidium pullulans]THY79936.1 aldo/keto reductase [Aureobasidium pullulans]THZ45564.1 aldo/keto reductase [Aureobasidium pullulans]
MFSSVPLRKLGKDGPEIPSMGYGMMGLSQPVYGSVSSEEDKFAILDRAYGLGARHWDSSDLYNDNEETVGKWFKRTGKREEIFLATKFGFVKGKFPELDSTGEYAKKACEESLRILGVEYIDLYYLHHPNPKTPIEDTMRGLKELQDQGKIKHIGLSSISSKTLLRASKIAKISAVQVGYSPFELDIESSKGTDLLATCRHLGIAIIAAMPLGRGILTSTFANNTPLDPKDMRPTFMPRFQAANKQKNVDIAKQWRNLADSKNCTSAQLALAWLLKQGEDIFVIPGTKQIKYLEENCGALGVELSDEDVTQIRRFAETADIAGGSLPPNFENFTFSDTVEEGSWEG